MKFHQIKHYNLKMAKLPPRDVTLPYGAYLHVIIFSKTQPILMHLYFHFPVKPVHMPISTLLVFWSPPFLKPLPSRYCEVKASKAGCQEIESLKKLPAWFV